MPVHEYSVSSCQRVEGRERELGYPTRSGMHHEHHMSLESSHSGRVHCKIGCKMDCHREIRVGLTGRGGHRDS